MRFYPLPPREWAKAAIVGLFTGAGLTVVMVPAGEAGLTPFPKPVALAFAETLLGEGASPATGIGLHLAYVTFWSMAFVALFRDALTLRNAIALSLVLWVIALVVFFPVIGWGPLGVAIGPQAILGALVPHLLFGGLLWLLCRFAFPPGERSAGAR